MIDGIFNGVVNFLLFGMVVGLRRLIHKEGLSSFLIHIDKRGWILFIEGMVTGVLLFTLYPVIVIILGQGSFKIISGNIFDSVPTVLFIGFGMLAVSTFEEALFRGYIFVKLLKKYSTGVAILIPSILFGFLHFFAYSSSIYFWLGLINATLVAILLCLIVVQTKSLMLAIGYHMSWNLVQDILLVRKNTFITLEIEESILTGGIYNPEAGLIVSGILLVMGLYLFMRQKMGRSANWDNTLFNS